MAVLWRGTEPTDTTEVRIADNYIRDNWAAIQDAFNREHTFTTGIHNAGKVGVIHVGKASACSTVAPSTPEASGAICYATDKHMFMYWNGTAWEEYYYYVKSGGDTLSSAWTIPGSYIDGRDPSRDGAILDHSGASSDYAACVTGKVFHGGTVPAITGFARAGSTASAGSCAVFIAIREMNWTCYYWPSHSAPNPWDINCKVNPTTWVVSAYYSQGVTPYGFWVNYLVIGRKYIP